VKINPIRFGPGESKEFRAEWALMEYQRGKVAHTESFYDLEVQMMSFPNVPNDDLVDSVTAPVYIIRKAQKQAAANAGPAVQRKNYGRR
jgi:phage terminase large subunit-like protein